jgi:capsular exopolysaccharide synthesis family protein
VLLVDTDLRRPRVHRSFGIANKAGVSSIIVGEMDSAQAIVSTEVPNLDILPSGPIPPNPAELLHAERFLLLMKELAKSYDRVIYDTPPVSLVTDPAVIGNLADGVVLVTRAGHTTREAASFAHRQLTDAKVRMLGVILNRIDPTDRRYDYYYSQYYRQYGYGYYSDSTDNAAKA